MRANRLVERGAAILRRLDSARAAALAGEIEDMWRREWTIGLVEEQLEARTRCIDTLCGGGLFDVIGRAPGCATIRVRRGSMTRFRATLPDGTQEVVAMSAHPESSGDILRPPSPNVDELRGDLAKRTALAERADEAVPPALRERPRWWAFWSWIVRWWLLLFARRTIEARDRAIAARDETRRRLHAAETDVVVQAPHDHSASFIDRLRALSSGKLVGKGVREIVIEVEQSLLPEGVELVELADSADLTVTFDGGLVRIADDNTSLGPIEQAVTEFSTLAARARAGRLARRARDLILEELLAIETRIEQTEIGFRNRIARLEGFRLPEPARFKTEQLERVHSQVMTSVNAVIQNVSGHLATELMRLAATWAHAVDAVTSTDELKATALRIDSETPESLTRIGDEVRRLISAGIAGSLHDIHPALVAELRTRGMTDADLREPASSPVPPLDKLRTLTAIKARGLADEIGGIGKWVAGLFRSLDTRRTELADLLAKHSANLHERAMDELLEAEPELRVALLTMLLDSIDAAVSRQIAWLDKVLVDEHARIATERELLAPQKQLVESVRAEITALFATPEPDALIASR